MRKEKEIIIKLIEKHFLNEIIKEMKRKNCTIRGVDLETIVERFLNDVRCEFIEEKEWFYEELQRQNLLNKKNKIKKVKYYTK